MTLQRIIALETLNLQQKFNFSSSESIASKVIEYLDGDTILFWTNENEKLEK